MKQSLSTLSRLIACLAILMLMPSCGLSSESSSNSNEESSESTGTSRKSEYTAPKEEVDYSGFTNSSVDENPSDEDNPEDIVIMTNSSDDE